MLRRIGRALVILALVAAALICFYLWLFHGWLAGGPPTPNPEWHRTWSIRFLVAGMLFAVAAVALTWRRGEVAPIPDQVQPRATARSAA
jgi:hypothetical protein